jgi:nicotinate-nucleotide adenylyltransferase
VNRVVPAHALGFAPRRRVGVLGGSFNPAHDGHCEIALAALRLVRLDEVWLLVSPGNPLKPTAGMASFEDRLASARHLTEGHPRLRIVAIERELRTRFTVETLAALRRRFPRTQFVWLMGADNLVQIPAWKGWTSIFRHHSIAVFARPQYSVKALAGKAARTFSTARIQAREAGLLARFRPPAWVFLHTRLNPVSATAIRAERRRKTG